jgi:hypothetical protein
MYGLTMSMKEFSLDDPEEDMAALYLRMKSGRNRSKPKHDERTIYGPRGIRGIIYQKVQ